MCFYCRCEKIAQSNKGHVLRGWEKKDFAIQFGNIDIMMKKKQFISFSNFLNKLTDEHLAEMSNMWTNKIIIHKQEFMGGYSFERMEFYEFRELINEVIGQIFVEEEVSKILKNQA